MASSSSSSPEAPARIKYVGFWKRFVAFVVDSIVALAVMVPLLLAVHSATEWQRLSDALQHALAEAQGGAQVDTSALLRDTGFSGPLDVLIQVVLPIVALLAFWKFRNSTPGKMVFRAKIVDATTGNAPSDARLLIRFLGYFASILTLGIGFLWIAIDRRKQGLHDKIAHTVVVRDD